MSDLPKYSRTFCKACADPAMRAEMVICPLCGGFGDKQYLELIARQFYEWCRDREEDERVFGTKPTIQ